MIKVFGYLKRKPGLSPQEFAEYYEHNHVPLVLSKAFMPMVYKRNYIQRGDAFNIEGCWQIMLKPSFNILRDRKLAMCAQACVDSALWDAVGKALGAPVLVDVRTYPTKVIDGTVYVEVD